MKWARFAKAGMIAALIAGLLACQSSEWPDPGSDWECKTSWTWDRDGVFVPCSVVQRVTRAETRISTTGTLSLGDAQWHETTESTWRVDDDEMCGKRTATTTTPKNDAAREFERDRLAGRPLSSGFTHYDFCVELVSATDTRMTLRDKANARILTCRRL